MRAGPEEVEVVGDRSEADPCSTVVDGVWIGEMAGAPFTVGAVDLRKPVGKLDAVGEVGDLGGVDVAVGCLAHGLEAESLDSGVLVGVLCEEPSAVGAVFTDCAASWPALVPDEVLQPGGVVGVHSPEVFDGFPLLGVSLCDSMVVGEEALDGSSGVLILMCSSQKLAAESFVDGHRSLALRSRSLLVEPVEEAVEDALSADLALGSGVVALALDGGPELDGGLEEGAGLADRLEVAVEPDGAGAVAVAEQALVHLGAELAHLGALGVGGQFPWRVVEGLDLLGDRELLVGDGAVGEAGIHHGHAHRSMPQQCGYRLAHWSWSRAVAIAALAVTRHSSRRRSGSAA